MVELRARALARLWVPCALALALACTWTSTDRYAQGELACRDAQACDAMWNAASSWIVAHSALALQRSDSLLESRCGSRSGSAPCYTVLRQPQQSGEMRIRVYIACGSDYLGCEQPATALRNRLTEAMLGASSAE